MSIRRLEARAYPDMPTPGAEDGHVPRGGGRSSMPCASSPSSGTPWASARRCSRSTWRKSAAHSPATPTSSGGQPSAAELAAGVTGGADAALDFQAIERSMTEGHPCFVANNGRLGFGIADYRSFAPEAGAPVQLEWIAVHRTRPSSRPPRPRLPEPPRRRTGGARRRVLRRRARRPRPGPGGLSPHARPPVAMGEQALRDLRRRNRAAAHRPSRHRRGRLPGPAVHPDVLQHGLARRSTTSRRPCPC